MEIFSISPFADVFLHRFVNIAVAFYKHAYLLKILILMHRLILLYVCIWIYFNVSVTLSILAVREKNTPIGLFRVIHALDNVCERDKGNCNWCINCLLLLARFLSNRYDVNKIMWKLCTVEFSQCKYNYVLCNFVRNESASKYIFIFRVSRLLQSKKENYF